MLLIRTITWVMYTNINLSTRKRWQCTKSLSIRLEKLGDDHPDVADTYGNLATVYEDQGKQEEALAMREKALSSELKKLETTILMLLLRTITWVMYTNIKQVRESVGNVREVSVDRIEELGHDHPDVAHTYNNGKYTGSMRVR